jgi:CheY-like chemotaxis protein
MILLIDDDRIVHFIVNRTLAPFRVNIVHSRDGKEGLDMAMDLRPDLVITDALLPSLDGRELARMVKTDPRTANCSVVVMSGLYKGLRYRNEALQTFRADDYLEKPVSPKNLIACVSRFIDLEPAAARTEETEPAEAGSPHVLAQ